MAAPRRNRSDPNDPLSKKTRDKIQTTKLRQRLEHFALGQKDDGDQKVEMSAQQVRAALGLLKKTMPDLQSVQLIGDADNPVETNSKLQVEFINVKGKGK